MADTQSQSFGQKAVGLSFNPSNDDAVSTAKQGYANIIDQMNHLRSTSESQEQKRLASVAITEAQSAQMWAVKALTWKDKRKHGMKTINYIGLGIALFFMTCIFFVQNKSKNQRIFFNAGMTTGLFLLIRKGKKF